MCTIAALWGPCCGSTLRSMNECSQIGSIRRIRILWELDVVYSVRFPSEREVSTSCKEFIKTLDRGSLIPIGKHRKEELGQAEQYIPQLVARKMYGAMRLRL